MEYYNNTFAVEAQWLINEGIVSELNYKQLTQRGQFNVVRRACRNTPALVAYDSMPERYKMEIQRRVGDPYKFVRVNQLEVRIEPSASANDYFETYKLADGRFLPRETRREYYINAIVLNAIHKLISDKGAKRRALGHRSNRAWDEINEAVQELDRSKYPHTLPANARRLEDRYKKYMQGGFDTLIHKNFTNKNAAKVDSDVKEGFIIELMADPRNWDNAQVMRHYNQLAEPAGWKLITAATVAVWRDKYDTMIFAGRRGSVAFSNKKGMQVKRSAPTAPLYYWSLDGWETELLYQRTETNKRTGYQTTTYHHRPTVVVVLDTFCKYPIGYAVGENESPSLIRAALRNAAQHTAELYGKMYRSHQIQSDHYDIKQMSVYYEMMAIHSTPARVKNAKAKVIEPYFKQLNKNYCQMQRNWSGFGITSNKNSQPNTEYLNKYKKNFPTYDAACAQVVEIMEAERAAKREQMLSRWAEMDEADKVELPLENYLLAFGVRHEHTNMMGDNGMKVTINGIKRDYDCFDNTMRDHMSKRWTICYDPADVSRVLAVSEDESLRYLMEEKYIQPMALKDRKPGDGAQLQRVRDFNAIHEQRVTDFRAENIEKMQQLVPFMLQSDTLRKLLITDSHGQHKNHRSGEALQSKQPKVVAVAPEVQEFDPDKDFLNLY